MPHAAPASAVPIDPAALLPAPPTTNPLRGNPDLALAPAQPARGQAPHGGRSPGPRTPETLPRQRRGRGIPVCDVRTIHGTFGSNARAENHDRRTLLHIGLVGIALDRYQAHLPPAPSAAREGHRRPVQPCGSNHPELIP
jgi:hypothetical protein